MKYTNERNLPEPLVRALQSDTYDRQSNRVSVTDLLKSDRAFVLARRHEAELVEDVSDSLWRFMGSAVGAMLEKGEGANDLKEERLTVGEITGRFDYYESATETLYDYKVTSTYKVRSGDYEDYIMQLSLYAALLEKSLGFKVSHIKNILILRDWTKRDMGTCECPIHVVEHQRLTKIGDMPILDWAVDRVAQIRAAEHLPEDSLAECSLDYRWATEDTWAVYWNESKAAEPRAQGVFKNEIEATTECGALNAAGKGKKTYRVELRRGEAFKRCAYCNARAFCNQYRAANPEGIPE